MESTSQLSGQKRKVRGRCIGPPLLVVSTSRPSFAATTSAGSGSLTLICPRTGTVQSSCRIQGGDLQSNIGNGLVGIKTLSFFPSTSNDAPATDQSASIAIAYGTTTGAQRSKGADASYGMLFTVSKSSTAPILHWKCHLPEPDMSAGLLVSPVSRHIVAGGSSGTLYVWNPLQGGCLVRSIPSAHYRAITCMQWSVAKEGSLAPPSPSSPWDCHLITGGADGMVHMFSHLDLVEQPSSSSTSNASVKPIRTWTKHHLAVTALVALNGGRMVSASDDGQVVIMELCSGETVATFQMPDPIKALTTDGERRIFAGSSKGDIYIVDLDEFAIHQTVQLGATIVHQQEESIESRVLGSTVNSVREMTDNATASSSSFLMELRGHDSAITSLVVFEDEQGGRNTEYLVSGDESGLIRVWDSRRRCCLCLVHPWSSTACATTSSTSSKGKPHAEEAAQYHPVTSIHVMREQTNSLGGSIEEDFSILGNVQETKRTKSAGSIAGMIAPLQKYSSIQDTLKVPVPYLEPRRGGSSLFTNLGAFSFERALVAREAKSLAKEDKVKDVETSIPTPSDNNKHQQEEIERLKKELEEAKATIQRWEVVNNKLVGKLKECRNE